MPYKDKISAIYLVTNLKNNKRYVGGTSNYKHRLVCHRSEIKNKCHHNSNIQEDLEKFGYSLDDFSFSILEVLETNTEDEIVSKEQEWMDRLIPEYNINAVAGRYIGEYIRTDAAKEKANKKKRGRKQSQEEKDKRAASIRKYWATHPPIVLSEEKKKHLREINMGNKNPNWGKSRSEESKRKISESNSKFEYMFISPDGNKVKLINLQNIDKSLNFPTWSARALVSGRVKVSRGWTFIEKTRIKQNLD